MLSQNILYISVCKLHYHSDATIPLARQEIPVLLRHISIHAECPFKSLTTCQFTHPNAFHSWRTNDCIFIDTGEFYQKMWTDISILVNKQKYRHFA